MSEVFQLQIRKEALKYFERLDSSLKERIRAKLRQICADPFDVEWSKPLVSTDKRSTRVGAYRVLFIVVENVVLVTDIDSRGGVYKRL